MNPVVKAYMRAHNAFCDVLKENGYRVSWDDDGNGNIYSIPTRTGDWPVATVSIRWKVKENPHKHGGDHDET